MSTAKELIEQVIEGPITAFWWIYLYNKDESKDWIDTANTLRDAKKSAKDMFNETPDADHAYIYPGDVDDPDLDSAEALHYDGRKFSYV